MLRMTTSLEGKSWKNQFLSNLWHLHAAVCWLYLFAQNTSSGNTTHRSLATWGKMKQVTPENSYAPGRRRLFSGNNSRSKACWGSLRALRLGVDAVLTPIAVMDHLGGIACTCGILKQWKFPVCSRVRAVNSRIALTADPLGGVYYKGRAGAALQFDTGVIFPGDWTSVLLRTYHEFMYQGYTGAKAGEAWEYETSGAKVNGVNYKGEYLIGYKLPIKLNMVALQLNLWYEPAWRGSIPAVWCGAMAMWSSLRLELTLCTGQKPGEG